MPALYYRDHDGQLPSASRIIGCARSELGREAFVAQINAALRRHVAEADLDELCLSRFLDRLRYVAVDAEAASGFEALAAELPDPERVRVFYLATSPELFGPICGHLAAAGLITTEARVVLEKAIGHDLASARAIND